MNFEKEFIEKLKKQDQRAFNEFYLKTVDMFFRYLHSNYFLDKEDTEDIISDFYIRWWKVVCKYDFKQSFAAFVWTVFKNIAKDHLKKRKDLWFSNLDAEDNTDFEDTLEDEVNVLDLLEQDFQYDQIKKAMDVLDNESKEIIYWKFIEEMENDEIGKILWISNDNVRQKISRSIKKLKTLLDTD